MHKTSWKLRGGLAREAAEAVRSSPSLRAAARRLGVSHSTLSRAVKDGRIAGRTPAKVRATPEPVAAEDWLSEIEQRYELSPTERELAKLAAAALTIAADPDVSPAVKLAAAGRFAQLVKDLNLPVEESYGDVTKATRGYPRPA